MGQTNIPELENKVSKALDQLRPFLEADGGDMRLVKVTDEMIAVVELIGACSNCSMSMMTLKAGVEDTVKKEVPEIKGVEAINMPDPETATPFGR